MAEYIQNGQNNYGWNLTWKMSGKYPVVADRIYETLAAAQAYVDDVKSNACKGVVLSVVNDGDNNGLYLVLDYATASVTKGTLKKIGSDIALSIAKVSEGLPTNVKEAYQLVDDKGNAYGAQIPIYKDSSLKGVIIKETDGKQFLSFTYLTFEGTENVVDLDVSQFLAEAEFDATKGLSVNNGVVSVNLSTDAETSKWMKFDETSGALKLVGLTDAIADAKKAGTDAYQFANEVNVKLGDYGDTALDPTIIGNEEASAFARIANLYEIVAELTGGSTSSVGSQINTAIGNYNTNTVQPALAERPTTEVVEEMIAGAVDGLEKVTATYNEANHTLTLRGIETVSVL